jgi:hypothetical protein
MWAPAALQRAAPGTGRRARRACESGGGAAGPAVRPALNKSSARPAGGGGGGMGGCELGERSSGVLHALGGPPRTAIAGGAGAYDSDRTLAGAASIGVPCARAPRAALGALCGERGGPLAPPRPPQWLS